MKTARFVKCRCTVNLRHGKDISAYSLCEVMSFTTHRLAYRMYIQINIVTLLHIYLNKGFQFMLQFFMVSSSFSYILFLLIILLQLFVQLNLK